MQALYTPEQRQRRDASPWTIVQGVLAPIQLLVCLLSIGLVLYYLRTGEGETVAHWSIWTKTVLLILIMLTGCLWEKEVFGQYLFAPAFFWEDVVSAIVITLHGIYVWGLFANWPAGQLMGIALCAYAAYLINAAQFLWKLRIARLQSGTFDDSSPNSRATTNMREPA